MPIVVVATVWEQTETMSLPSVPEESELFGLAVTEWVMAHVPTPILIVSASLNRGEVFQTYDALAAGAVDVLDKPTGGEVDNQWEVDLVSALRMVSKIRVITHLRGRRNTPSPTRPATRRTASSSCSSSDRARAAAPTKI